MASRRLAQALAACVIGSWAGESSACQRMWTVQTSNGMPLREIRRGAGLWLASHRRLLTTGELETLLPVGSMGPGNLELVSRDL